MSGPRYSIIPAAAITDIRLKGRALQVLAVLGSHTDREGWCSRSQGGVARQLGCGRSTVHRAIGILVTCGYVQQRELFRADGGDRSHEYRVLLDEIRPAPYISEIDDGDRADADEDLPEGPPAAPVSMAGQGCPPSVAGGVSTHGRTPNRTTSSFEREGERGARRDPDADRRQALALAEADSAFMHWFQSWPTSASDSIVRTHAAWLKLADHERQEAESHSAAAVADHTIRLKRRGCYGATTYLEEKRWRLLPAGAIAKAGQPATLSLPARGQAWFAVFWRRWAAGEPVRVMFDSMTRGVGYTVRLADIPTAAEMAAMVKIAAEADGRTSPEMIAWQAAMAGAGVSFAPHAIGMPFVWVPSLWPPGHGNEAAKRGEARA